MLEETEDYKQVFPEVLTAFGATWAVTRSGADASVKMEEGDLKTDFHVLKSVSHQELAS